MPRKAKTDVVVPRGPKWRKLEIVAWTDSTVRGLSAPQPNAQTLWHYLLTGPRTTTFPGLVVARQAVLASDLGWSGEAFREVFLELCTAGLIEADEQGGVILLRKALFNGPKQDRLSVRESARPESPNALKGWAKSWSEVPDSYLKDKYLSELGAFAEALGEGYREAYREGFAKALAKATRSLPGTFEDTSAKVSSNQEKENEKEKETDPPTSLSVPVAAQTKPVVDPLAADLGVARRALVQEIWKQHLALFAMLKAEGFDGADRIPPRGHGDAGETELAARVSEMFREFAGDDPVAKTRERCLLVLSIAGAEARKNRSLEWLDGGLWKSNRLANLSRKRLSAMPLATRQRFPWTTATAVEEPRKRTTKFVLLEGERIEVDE